MFPTEHRWRMSQSALSETRVPFLPLLVECLTYGRMRQYFFPHSVETERQKGLNTERQNDRIQKYKKTTLLKATISAGFKLSFEGPVSQLVLTRAVSELVSDKDKQTITSRGP